MISPLIGASSSLRRTSALVCRTRGSRGRSSPGFGARALVAALGRTAPRTSAALAALLFLGGLVATLYHLATEQHSDPGRATASSTCRGSSGGHHAPHSASDHETDRTAETVSAVSVETPGLAPLAFADLDLIESRLVAVQRPLLSRAHVPRGEPPPALGWCRRLEHSRAPPAA
jgi:hypothetical protein